MDLLRLIGLSVVTNVTGGAIAGALAGVGTIVYFGIRSGLLVEGASYALPLGAEFGGFLGLLLGVCVAVATTVALAASLRLKQQVRRWVYAGAAGVGAIPVGFVLVAGLLQANPFVVSAIFASATVLISGLVVFPLLVQREPPARSVPAGDTARQFDPE